MSTDPAEKRRPTTPTQASRLEEVGTVSQRASRGTVREDYSDNGDAWNYFTHDQARSRAYRWRGWPGRRQRRSPDPVFRPGAVDSRDPILKERAFGLANSEGNHGEDVKECYFYLDSTPTHSS
jgi:hypothetical protein